MKCLLNLFLVFNCLVFANVLKPSFTYLASGGTSDLVLKKDFLYISTSVGIIDIFNIKTHELKEQIKIPKTTDFLGDKIASKIYSLDVLKNKILFVSQGEKGYRELYEIENKQIKPIIKIDKKMYISKAKYLDETKIILSLLSNQLFVYDLKKKEFLWETQVSQSKFSNFALNERKSEIYIADESGSIKKISTKNGKLEKIFSGSNVDNVFQIDVKNGILITAGQDRRCAIYNGFNQYYKKSDFLIYSAGLSPSGKIAGYANDEDNDIAIFNTQTKDDLYTLKGHKMTLTNILFKSEHELFSSSDGNEVYFWKLP